MYVYSSWKKGTRERERSEYIHFGIFVNCTRVHLRWWESKRKKVKKLTKSLKYFYFLFFWSYWLANDLNFPVKVISWKKVRYKEWNRVESWKREVLFKTLITFRIASFMVYIFHILLFYIDFQIFFWHLNVMKNYYTLLL